MTVDGQEQTIDSYRVTRSEGRLVARIRARVGCLRVDGTREATRS